MCVFLGGIARDEKRSTRQDVARFIYNMFVSFWGGGVSGKRYCGEIIFRLVEERKMLKAQQDEVGRHLRRW